MSKFIQGVYKLQNPQKYVGKGQPRYRSGWEWKFFQFCDNNDAVLEWASEAIAIKYRHPITGKITSYVPDVFMRYRTRNNKICTEIIEIKPAGQTTITERTRPADRVAAVINQAKWQAARAWCKNAGIVFRVITENEMFHKGGTRR